MQNFFNISAEEAHLLDPEIRILLENTYAAIIDADVNPAELQSTRTGIVTTLTVCDSYADVVRKASCMLIILLF